MVSTVWRQLLHTCYWLPLDDCELNATLWSVVYYYYSNQTDVFTMKIVLWFVMAALYCCPAFGGNCDGFWGRIDKTLSTYPAISEMDLDCDGVLEPHEVQTQMDEIAADKYIKTFDRNDDDMIEFEEIIWYINRNIKEL
ncbi:uncharacterized protein LOC121373713 [Gigantopelta aegis]|uniref:uncharacterized protein LOC121373713 n=1 Tax=Gigantopelta aegis TaxID=1735272 RepID=UPI001B889042|nr:uncharacterized protein LOC121373713 [Gigantopelta aegis]